MLSESSDWGYRARPATRDLLNRPCLVARPVRAGIIVSMWSKYYTVLHKLWSSARKMKIEAKRLTITTSGSGVGNRGRDRPTRYCSKLHITTSDMIDSFLPQKIPSYWRITKVQTPTHQHGLTQSNCKLLHFKLQLPHSPVFSTYKHNQEYNLFQQN